MIFGQKMKSIIITIIKHHNSKDYIHSIFISTYDNYRVFYNLSGIRLQNHYNQLKYRYILHLRMN
jgi:hypothetical protein